MCHLVLVKFLPVLGGRFTRQNIALSRLHIHETPRLIRTKHNESYSSNCISLLSFRTCPFNSSFPRVFSVPPCRLPYGQNRQGETVKPIESQRFTLSSGLYSRFKIEFGKRSGGADASSVHPFLPLTATSGHTDDSWRPSRRHIKNV